MGSLLQVLKATLDEASYAKKKAKLESKAALYPRATFIAICTLRQVCAFLPSTVPEDLLQLCDSVRKCSATMSRQQLLLIPAGLGLHCALAAVHACTYLRSAFSSVDHCTWCFDCLLHCDPLKHCWRTG